MGKAWIKTKSKNVGLGDISLASGMVMHQIHRADLRCSLSRHLHQSVPVQKPAKWTQRFHGPRCVANGLFPGFLAMFTISNARQRKAVLSQSLLTKCHVGDPCFYFLLIPNNETPRVAWEKPANPDSWQPWLNGLAQKQTYWQAGPIKSSFLRDTLRKWGDREIQQGTRKPKEANVCFAAGASCKVMARHNLWADREYMKWRLRKADAGGGGGQSRRAERERPWGEDTAFCSFQGLLGWFRFLGESLTIVSFSRKQLA